MAEVDALSFEFLLAAVLDLPFAEKLTTIAHELLHVGERFDGDLRQLWRAVSYAHTHSHAAFDAPRRASSPSVGWRRGPDDDLYSFLLLDFLGLQARHGRIYGRKITAPKLIPAE